MTYDKSQFEIDGTVLKKYIGNQSTVNIPNGVTAIGDSAFSECNSPKNIIIPDSVTSIGKFAFSRCENLFHVEIPNSVTAIGEDSFYSCKNLVSVRIPASVKMLDGLRFSNCQSLESIVVADGNPVYSSKGNCLIKKASKTLLAGCNASVIPLDGSVTRIEQLAFTDFDKLSYLAIPKCVVDIGYSAFLFCFSLKVIDYEGSPSEWQKISKNAAVPQDCKVNFGVNLNSNIQNAQMDLGAIRKPEKETPKINLDNYDKSEFDISDGVLVKYTGNKENVDIPYGVTTIGKEAFLDNETVCSINIPDTVTNVEYNAFKNCAKLNRINIPESVTSIGFRAFDGTEIYNNPANWDDVIITTVNNADMRIVFGYLYIDNVLIKAVNAPILKRINNVYYIKDGTRLIADKAFSYEYYNLIKIIFPDSVKYIGCMAFSTYSNILNEINIGNNVLKINSSAFESSLISEISLPDSLTSIGSFAFSKCKNLKEIVIPENVEIVGNYAFSECTSLEKIYIPKNIKYIRKGALKGCKALKTIEFGGTKKQWHKISRGCKKPLFCKVVFKEN